MGESIAISDIQWEIIICGLGLFLLGIKLMGDNLTNFAGSKIRKYIEKYTSTPLKAILVGIVLTGLIQSSSATTVIAISLVRADLMTLQQAIGITLGANLGTTITSVLIGFDLGYFSYYILIIGVLMIMFSRRKKMIYMGNIIAGFALLFVGLNLMGESLEQLQYVEGFTETIVKMGKHPGISASIGAILTALIQSSSAFVGIIQKLYDAGALTLLPAIGMVFGANIGTTVTAILASIGGSVSAKRTALFHFCFNLISSLIFLAFIHPFANLITWLAAQQNLNPMMTIALAHIIFNFAGVIIFAPLTEVATDVLKKIIPGREINFFELAQLHLDDSVTKSFPAQALQQSQVAIEQVAEISFRSLKSAERYYRTRDPEFLGRIQKFDEVVDDCDKQINSFLLKISKDKLSTDQSSEYSIHVAVERKYERISQAVANMASFLEMAYEENSDFTKVDAVGLDDMFALLTEIYACALQIYKTKDAKFYDRVQKDQDKINELENKIRQEHFIRITDSNEQPNKADLAFDDIIIQMELIGSLCFDIARMTINPSELHPEDSTPSHVFFQNNFLDENGNFLTGGQKQLNQQERISGQKKLPGKKRLPGIGE